MKLPETEVDSDDEPGNEFVEEEGDFLADFPDETEVCIIPVSYILDVDFPDT